MPENYTSDITRLLFGENSAVSLTGSRQPGEVAQTTLLELTHNLYTIEGLVDPAIVPLAIQEAVNRKYAGEQPDRQSTQREIENYARTFAESATHRARQLQRALAGKDPSLVLIPQDFQRASEQLARLQKNNPIDAARLEQYRTTYYQLYEALKPKH